MRPHSFSLLARDFNALTDQIIAVMSLETSSCHANRKHLCEEFDLSYVRSHTEARASDDVTAVMFCFCSIHAVNSAGETFYFPMNIGLLSRGLHGKKVTDERPSSIVSGFRVH